MPKTIRELAKDALDIQDACNLSGVVHSFYLRSVCEQDCVPYSLRMRNRVFYILQLV